MRDFAVDERSAKTPASPRVRVVLGVDEFDDQQLCRIAEATEGWGVIDRVGMKAGAGEWRAALGRGPAEIAIGWPPVNVVRAGQLRFVQLGSSGWDAYAGQGLEDDGVMLCNARGIYSVGVAEHAIGMMMALVRRVPQYVHDKDARAFRRHPPYPDEVAGASAAVIGLGDIGREIMTRCRGLGMHVVGLTRQPDLYCAEADEVRHAGTGEQLAAALSDADHVFLAFPGSDDNVRLIDDTVLRGLKRSARLYNVARGSVVDELALVAALRDGRLAGAGLDVVSEEPLPAESPLWQLDDNVLITGHSAGVSRNHPERFCRLILRNLERYRRGEPLENRVL